MHRDVVFKFFLARGGQATFQEKLIIDRCKDDNTYNSAKDAIRPVLYRFPRALLKKYCLKQCVNTLLRDSDGSV